MLNRKIAFVIALILSFAMVTTPIASAVSAELNETQDTFVYKNEGLGFSITMPKKYVDKVIFEELGKSEGIIGSVNILHKSSRDAAIQEIGQQLPGMGVIGSVTIHENWEYTKENSPIPFLLEEHNGKKYVYTTPTDVQYYEDTRKEYLEIYDLINKDGGTEAESIMPGMFAFLDDAGDNGDDVPSKGEFVYKNRELGFSLTLPAKYRDKLDFVDVEKGGGSYGGVLILHRPSRQAHMNEWPDDIFAGVLCRITVREQWDIDHDSSIVPFVMQEHNDMKYIFLPPTSPQYTSTTEKGYNEIYDYMTSGHTSGADSIMPGVFQFIDDEMPELPTRPTDGIFEYVNDELGFSLTLPEKYEDKLVFEDAEKSEDVTGGIQIIHKASRDALESEDVTASGGVIAQILLYEDWEHTELPFVMERHRGIEYVYLPATDMQNTDDTRKEYMEISDFLSKDHKEPFNRIMPGIFEFLEEDYEDTSPGSEGGGESGESSDIDSHWARSAVLRWNRLGIFNGYDDGNYRPDNNINRAEMASLMGNLMDYIDRSDNTYSDVEAGSWYEEAISMAVEAGIMGGYGDGRVGPTDNLTRQDAVVMFCKALGIQQDDRPGGFKDADEIADYALGYVNAMSNAGLISGYGDAGEFKPRANITRAEIVTIMNNSVSDYITKPGSYLTEKYEGNVIVIHRDAVFINCDFKANVIFTRSENTYINVIASRVEGRIIGTTNRVTLPEENSEIIDLPEDAEGDADDGTEGDADGDAEGDADGDAEGDADGDIKDSEDGKSSEEDDKGRPSESEDDDEPKSPEAPLAPSRR